MSANHPKRHGHSADVRIQLLLNGHAFSVAQLGPGYMILRDPIDHPPAEAKLIIQIDGHEDTRELWLADGIRTGEPKTPMSRKLTAAAAR